MAKLPNGHLAIVPDSKLIDYCLSETHWEGKHKARVFRAALGLTVSDAGLLKSWLLSAAKDGEAMLLEMDGYGLKYQIDFVAKNGGKVAMIRSGWRQTLDESVPPRLSTCYILER